MVSLSVKQAFTVKTLRFLKCPSTQGKLAVDNICKSCAFNNTVSMSKLENFFLVLTLGEVNGVRRVSSEKGGRLEAGQ